MPQIKESFRSRCLFSSVMCPPAHAFFQMTSILENTANSLPTYYLTLIRKRFLSYSTFASRQSPAVKYIISRSEVIAHPHHLTLPPSLNPSPRGRDLLSLQAVKKSGVSQMRNLSFLWDGRINRRFLSNFAKSRSEMRESAG